MIMKRRPPLNSSSSFQKLVMSGSTTVDYTFEWPAGPEEVLVTGEFDQWKGTMPLLKTSSGAFELTFPVEIPAGRDKVFFKFIVDGTWLASDAYTKGADENGIENNYISRSEALALSENPVGTKIPEAGGLVCATTGSEVKDDEIPEPGAYPKIPSEGETPGSEVKDKEIPEPGAYPKIPSEGESEEKPAFRGTSNLDAEDVAVVAEPTGASQAQEAPAFRGTANLDAEDVAVVAEPTGISQAEEAPAFRGTSNFDAEDVAVVAEPTGTSQVQEPVTKKAVEAEKSGEGTEQIVARSEQSAKKAEQSAKKVKDSADQAKQSVQKAAETGNFGTGGEPSKTSVPGASATTSAPDPEPAAIPSLTVETIGPEESNTNFTPSGPSDKDIVAATITTPPLPVGTTVVPEVTGSTAAAKDTALDTIPTASSSDSKKRFKIKRRFKKNKITGEKTIVSEERVPLDSEESGTEHPLVDEELVASPTEATAGDVHIMPIGPPQSKNTEFKGLVGEPGPVIPQNVTEIKEFTEVRDVDADELNERLNKQEREREVAPVETEKREGHTLDPKSHQNDLKPQTSNKLYEVTNGESGPVKDEPDAKAAAMPAAAPAKEPAPEKPATAKNEKKPVQKTTNAAPKQEEKKKKNGFLCKLKKIFH